MKRSNVISYKKIKAIDLIKTPIALIGIGLIVIGVWGLSYIGLLVIDILKNPDSSTMIQWAQANLPSDEIVLTLLADNKELVIKASDTLQFLFYGFIALVILSALITVTRGLIAGGVQLLKLSYEEIPNVSSVNKSKK